MHLCAAQAASSEKDTVVFRLKVECKWKDRAAGEMENEKGEPAQLPFDCQFTSRSSRCTASVVAVMYRADSSSSSNVLPVRPVLS